MLGYHFSKNRINFLNLQEKRKVLQLILKVMIVVLDQIILKQSLNKKEIILGKIICFYLLKMIFVKVKIPVMNFEENKIKKELIIKTNLINVKLYIPTLK